LLAKTRGQKRKQISVCS